MCTVFLRHHLGRRGCGPERFRHNGKKGIVVDYRIGALYRIYHLFDIWIQKRQKNRFADIEKTKTSNSPPYLYFNLEIPRRLIIV